MSMKNSIDTIGNQTVHIKGILSSKKYHSWTFDPWRQEICFETSGTYYPIPRRYIPEESIPQLHRWDKLKLAIFTPVLTKHTSMISISNRRSALWALRASRSRLRTDKCRTAVPNSSRSGCIDGCLVADFINTEVWYIKLKYRFLKL